MSVLFLTATYYKQDAECIYMLLYNLELNNSTCIKVNNALHLCPFDFLQRDLCDLCLCLVMFIFVFKSYM